MKYMPLVRFFVIALGAYFIMSGVKGIRQEKAALQEQIKALEASQTLLIEMVGGINKNLNNLGIYGVKIVAKKR